ncbi:hypothetical protein STEG23_023740, partial [Scotinomys teguina]
MEVSQSLEGSFGNSRATTSTYFFVTRFADWRPVSIGKTESTEITELAQNYLAAHTKAGTRICSSDIVTTPPCTIIPCSTD